MMHWRWSLCTLFLFAATAIAQQRPIFDSDDFVDPRQHARAVFVSRLTLGGAANLNDDYRPQGHAGFAHFTNGFYWQRWQFDYKRTTVFAKNGSSDVLRCGCNPPIYFPTPPPRDAVPAPPPAGSKDTVQMAWYHDVAGAPSEPRVMLRNRVTIARQHIGTTVRSAATEEVLERRSGHEQSIGLDADTYFRVAGHNIWGSLQLAHTSRSGTIDNRSQTELAYTSRFPGWAVGPFLMRATFTVGGVTNRGASGVNVVNPAFEAFWHHHPSDANLHLIYSPQTLRSGLRGWQTHHQIALYVDRALYVKLFRPLASASLPERLPP